MKKCSICNLEFVPKVHNQLMCSKVCVRKYRTNFQIKSYHAKPKKIRSASCIICGSNFEQQNKSNAITCSKECSKIRISQRHALYRKDIEYLEKQKLRNKKFSISKKRKEWIQNNRKDLTIKNTLYVQARKKIDKGFHMITVLRAAIGRMYKRHNHVQTLKELIDYTPEQLKKHLESQFRDGMTWENYGRLGWHIDHKMPLTAFAFFDENGDANIEEMKKAMSLDNLQPLWYDENIRKGGANRMKLIVNK